MANVFQQVKDSKKSSTKSRQPKPHEYAASAYGSVDSAALEGKPNGSYITYHYEGPKAGKQLSKLVISVANVAEIIKGEVWANDKSLPQPAVIPFDAIPGYESRRTIRPFRDNLFNPYDATTEEGNQYFPIFAQALKAVLADETYGDACQELVDKFEDSIAEETLAESATADA